jgi:beta-galactosidase
MQTRFPAVLLSCAALCAGAEGDAYIQDGPRGSINLAGEWDAAGSGTLELAAIPGDLQWTTESVPSRAGSTALIPGNTPYAPGVATLLSKDGKGFAQTGALSAWFRREVEVPAAALEGRVPVLRLGGASYRMALWVNGRKVAESIQCLTPIDVDLGGFLTPGRNELVIAVTGREGLVDRARKCFIAPCSGAPAGIREPVQLQFLPPVALDDVFVTTSVGRKRIDFELTIVNRGRKATEVVPRVVVRGQEEPRQVLAEVAGKPLTVPVGGTSVVRLGLDWIAPQLWDLDSPVLYDAVAQLGPGGSPADELAQSFGFREFEIRGRDFYLNGRNVKLFRKLGTASVGATAGKRDRLSDRMFNGNSIRGVYGLCNEENLRAADRTGIMTIPELGWHAAKSFPAEARDVWLPNVLESFTRFVRHLRNHPSVVMWSLTNETYWGRNVEGEMAAAKAIAEHVAELDPSRPAQGDGEVSWNGLLPIINIHYPEGTAGTLRLKYPSSGVTIPNDLQWLNSDATADNASWRANFKWDRPLIVGEMWVMHEGTDNSLTSFMGDSIYDWEKWSHQSLIAARNAGELLHSGDLCYETLTKYCVTLRAAGVAGLNPLSADLSHCLPPVQVAPLDYHPNLPSGGAGQRKVVTFNDSSVAWEAMELQSFLTVEGATVWEDLRRLDASPGKQNELTLDIPAPEVDAPTAAQLTVRLRYQAGRAWHDLWRYTETLHIVPEFDLASLTDGLAVLDPQGSLKQALAALKLDGAPLATLDAAALRGKRALLIGRDAFQPGMAGMLERFVEGGGVVALMPQENWRPFRADLPERDAQHAATQAWVRAPRHPLLDGVSEGQLSFWRSDNVVSHRTFFKPCGGRFIAVLDCGGSFGMCWTPLLTVASGKGEYILTTLELDNAAEPVGRQLLANIVRYAATRPPQAGVPLNLLAGANTALRAALKLVGAETVDGVGATGPVLVDGSAELADADVTALATALATGRTIWAHGFTPQSLPTIQRLFPIVPELAKAPAGVLTCAVRPAEPLTDGLANFDFKWAELGPITGVGGYFAEAKATAKLGDWVVKLAGPKQGRPLTSPAFLAAMPVGPGRILLDTLRWEDAMGAEADKAGRIVAGLLNNLGGELRLEPAPSYDVFHVDLAPHATRGYHDKVANDGQGGWHDGGVFDMRFFLINHTGKAGGVDEALDVPVEPFPTKIRLGKTLYQLVDPKANGDKAVVCLRGGSHGATLPAGVGPIPVNARADTLWFLQSAAHCAGVSTETPVAEYHVEYDDGSRQLIPVRSGMEVGDWWNPVPLPKASVAYTCKTLGGHIVGVWTMPWKNPFPQKTIRSVTVKADLSEIQLMLLAITGGTVAERPAGVGATLADWDLSRFKDGKVACDVAVLSAGRMAPMPTDGGLRFADGASLEGDAHLPDLKGRPFLFSADFTPGTQEPGRWAGIFQGLGFRMFLAQSEEPNVLKMKVELYVGGKSLFLDSRATLRAGQRYRFDLTFDGRRAALLREGKVDHAVSCPLPGVAGGPLRVGVLSGIEGGYRGVIHRLTVSALEE